MSTKNIDICRLEDLDKFRSAPKLNRKQKVLKPKQLTTFNKKNLNND